MSDFWHGGEGPIINLDHVVSVDSIDDGELRVLRVLTVRPDLSFTVKGDIRQSLLDALAERMRKP